MFKPSRKMRGETPARLTKLQKLATRRNWCHYILKGMRAQARVFRKFGCNTANLDRALDAMEYSIDFHYFKQQEQL